jgi:hypothetical protein
MTGNLADFEKGKPILLKEAGTQFLESASTRQMFILLDAWWWHTNWLMMYQWQLFEEFPSHLPNLARALYRQVKPNTWVPIKEFVDDLIDLGKLSEASSLHRDALERGIERSVITVLEDFEVLELKRQPKTLGTFRFSDPVSFRLTRLGEQLLQLI